MKYKTSLFVFRRDLRLEDNTGLISALRQSERVIPCFIFDPRQVDDNEYRSDNAVQFMLGSLAGLDDELKKKGSKLFIFYGQADSVIRKLLKKVDAVFLNRDYTPFSLKRDNAIAAACRKSGVDFFKFADALLHEPEEVHKGDGDPYVVYTPFMKAAKKLDVRRPVKNKYKNYFSGRLGEKGLSVFSKVLKKGDYNEDIFRSGGRKEARRILKDIGRFDNYEDVRDFPYIDGTTGLSAHNKFGTVSIREFYHAVNDGLGFHSILIDELFWRDFFTHIAYHFPYVFGKPFRKKYEKLKWSDSKKNFKAWCEGMTGFPIVDAGMRQLNKTGFMHNRVRMIVGSFLTKDLRIDWRRGEKYFAQRLVDYDPSVNNGNWQWVASTGCDAQPYFRIFNPWSQQEKYDKKCKYIKEWVPELEGLSPSQIHSLGSDRPEGLDYPEPIVDHSEARDKALKMFKSV